MPKVPDSLKYHCKPQAIGSLNDLLITNGATGLDHGGDTHSGGSFYAVGEGEEGVRGQHRALGLFSGFG